MTDTMRDWLLRYARDRYGTEPDSPWEGHPRHAVLRHPENRRWYALVMELGKDRLGLSGDSACDVVNLKCAPEDVTALRLVEGILPAYHMNKDRWVSVLLDGSVSPELICELLDTSFRLTS